MSIIPKARFPQYLAEHFMAAPHHVCAEFIEWYELPVAKAHLGGWIKAAYRKKHWTYGSPQDLLHFYQSVLQLIEGVWLVNQNDNSKRLGNLSNNSMHDRYSVVNPALYCAADRLQLAFNFFPRNLSVKDIVNPYRVFSTIFHRNPIEAWKQDLHDMLQAALADHSMESLGTILDLVNIKQMLDRLFEATHLIVIREFNSLKEENS